MFKCIYLKKNNRTRIFKRFCWLPEFADLQLPHFSRLALFQFLHQNIIAGIEIMRVGWHQKARLKHHLKIAGPGRPSHPTMGTKTKWMSFWKWTANTMATLTYIKWTLTLSHFPSSVSRVSFWEACVLWRCLTLPRPVLGCWTFIVMNRKTALLGCVNRPVGKWVYTVFFPKEQLSMKI